MPKARKSNREAKKEPSLTLKEKRAAKKAKTEEKVLLGSDNAARKPMSISGTKR